VLKVPDMADDDTQVEPEDTPEYWRKLAVQTLRRAELAIDPIVQELLRSQAQDYMLKAAQLARETDRQDG
jgi:hypothetical protein